ncbi:MULTISPECIES: hypothetical protein [unclassified Vibrio]|uniref:hypothetical protein n=1 Tax=unclassified Vibrio TaxID=2614977 RepID=UPI0012686F56|nr:MULTISPECIES: hypothetical protein [unclassified Vibrio]QFT39682.1 hypothetical protein FIU99_25180 [Vibrio sp. THAF64]QGM37811.1 hypothetical protein GGC04_26300 [Vibrio sp. THAF191d]QGN73154.1 hypothetical protein GGC03_25525 [Vibrio sp. THAF191c]
METITFTEAEMEFIIEAFLLYSFAGTTAALLFYDALKCFFGGAARLAKPHTKNISQSNSD